ncbi:PKD domain-containing protein [Microbulbifer sp. ANSA003]|uniref:PKD domain-containing protein n=1 Tax=Microbulbifer sp. ANSA003 TaxID=3243360 RepID=UPI0040437C9E
MKRTMGLLALLCLSLFLAACSGGSSSSDSDAGSTVEKPIASIGLLAPAGNVFSLKDGNVTVQLNGTDSSSPRDANLTYRWELIELPALSNAVLSSSEDARTEFTADLPGDYVISLIVNDGTASSEAARMVFSATSPYPVAITEPVHSVAFATQEIVLDGSFSTIPTGETGSLEYLWTLTEKPQESDAYLTDSEQSLATLHLDVEGDYRLQLVVTFNDIASAPANVLVTVSSGNAPPVAVAKDLTVVLGEKVTLDASDSYDPEGSQLQYRWRWADVDPSTIPMPELDGETTSTLKFTPEAAGTYSFELMVFDGAKRSVTFDEDGDPEYWREIQVVVESDPEAENNKAPEGEVVATGYFPSASIGEQEVGLRAEFNFVGYDTEGDALQVIDAVLLEKPEGSDAELVDIGFWKPLGKKIDVLDVAGLYRVSMTISDGVNKIVREATMEAKIGQVNNQPSTRGVEALTTSTIVGEALIFEASSSDPDNDPMEFHWELVDKPDGSKATIEAIEEPESKEYRRARVVTDLPGSYTARLIVSDDRGLYAKAYEQADGFAKLINEAPQIRSAVWVRDWGRLSPGEDFYQILPCMSLMHRPVVVDPDGDVVFTHEELESTPEGGDYTSLSDSGDCAGTYGTGFTKPGTYKFRYYATDLIDESEYVFVVEVEPMSSAKGVRLREISENDQSLWHPMPYENIPSYATPADLASDLEPTEARYIQWSLTAADANYTIENVRFEHINGGLRDLTPWFEGLKEGQVIAEGESLDFQTWMPAVPCVRTDDRAEGFHFSFNIKEIPELTFVYETWIKQDDPFVGEDWRYCEAGELN